MRNSDCRKTVLMARCRPVGWTANAYLTLWRIIAAHWEAWWHLATPAQLLLKAFYTNRLALSVK
jgi:hypothetical protein